MTNMVLAPQGIAIAVVFTAAIVVVMAWMFRVPRPVSAEVAKARRSLDVARVILVATIKADYSERAVELACRLAQEQRAEVLLVYVIEVPRTLPLGAPLEEAEQEAKAALETAKAVVALHNLPVSSLVQRAREAGDGIITAAKDHRADLIVVGIGPHRGGRHLWGGTSETLLHRAPCEVIFDKLPG
jgi:nucleotide-binding universal stress UspA family protein